MDFDWQHYHRLNVVLLSVIGLWPFGNKLVLRLKRCVASSLAFVCCFSQLATFSTVSYTKTLLLNNAPIIFVGCGIWLKYVSFLAAGDCIKTLTETINDDWKALTSREEVRVIEKYVERGKFHTKGFTVLICPAGISLFLLPLSSVFLDIVMPLNESRRCSFPVMFEVFFDQEKYFFITLFCFYGCVAVGVLVFISTETLIIVYLQHACALFEVTSCRIRKLFHATEVRDSGERSNVVVIAQVVETHSKAIRHCTTLRENFLPPYIILLAFGILSLASHLLRCAQTTHELNEFLPSALFCLAIVGYMFYLHFIVQTVVNSSNDIFYVLYDTEWFTFPSSARRLILFCMLKSIKPVELDACGLYHPSFEGLSLIMRMAMSYATAFYSFQ